MTQQGSLQAAAYSVRILLFSDLQINPSEITTRKYAKGPPQKYRYENKPVPILDGTYGRALGTGW